MAAAQPLRFSAQDRRQQIMQVTMELFGRQGFEGTTTRQIAERARVNEALIFRHFTGKEDLYWAIIEDKCQVASRRAELQKKLQGNGGDRQAFAAIAEDIIRRRTKEITLTRLLFFTGLENHRLAHRFFRTHVAQYYEVLADHIRKRIREGVFRPVDPLLAGRGFLSMVIHHVLIQELFGGKRYQKFSPRRVGQVLADIWVEGLLARGGTPSPFGKQSRRR